MSTPTKESSASAIRFLQALFGSTRLESVSFLLWDGARWPSDRSTSATLVLKHPGALRRMFATGTETALAEAFLDDDFDVVGDIEAALELADALNAGLRVSWLKLAASYLLLGRSPHPRIRRPARGAASAGTEHSPERDRKAVSFHYDVSDEFFQLFLDREMLYSCGYFRDASDSLDVAQVAKMDHLCRKLRLRAGQRLLDIGCGWGGLALFAARNYNVRVLGVTLSRNQASFAGRRVVETGLQGTVAIELKDYRDVAGCGEFDAVVSVGMAEHVGRENLPAYFAKAARLLKPGGVFLNHAIGEGFRPRRSRGPSFIQRHVFPDSDVPALPIVVSAAESAGLEVRDVENLREHYMYTLRHWVRRLEEKHDAAVSLVSESTYRVWRLYMAASAHGFDRGNLAIYQTLLSKPDVGGRSTLPLSRDDWYTSRAPSDSKAAAPLPIREEVTTPGNTTAPS